MMSLRRLLFLPSFLFLTIFLTGCDFQSRQSTLDPKGPVAQSQLDLFMVTVYVTFPIFILVGGALLFVVIKFKAKPGDEKKLPPQGHGNPLIELSLVAASVGALVIIAIPTLTTIWYTHIMQERPEDHLIAWYPGEIAEADENEVLTIIARGWQWWFSFEYPQLGIVTANEFAIPKGKVVRFELRAQDVIHSFWLPKLAGKVDMIPGRTNWMWMQGDEVGHYYGQCAEFCGEAHAYMLFRADVLSVEDFKDWVAHQRSEAPPPNTGSWGEFQQLAQSSPEALADDPIQRGARLFMGRATCIQCHAVKGSIARGILGPDLTHVGSRVSLGAGWMDHRGPDGQIDAEKQFDNFYRWIRESEKIKPGNLMYYTAVGLQHVDLSDDDVRDLAHFMVHLR
jgi:cytochrome c oxidase subunit 2